MLDLNELEQLITFADMGTLSRAAEKFEFEELVRESSLPCFTTDLAKDDHNLLADRIKIPVTNPVANVTYHLACHSQAIAYTDALKRIDTNDIVYKNCSNLNPE